MRSRQAAARRRKRKPAAAAAATGERNFDPSCGLNHETESKRSSDPWFPPLGPALSDTGSWTASAVQAGVQDLEEGGAVNPRRLTNWLLSPPPEESTCQIWQIVLAQ